METKTQSSKESLVARFVYTVLFLVIGYFISTVVFFTTVFQFIYTMIFGKNQERVLAFTAYVGQYAKDVIDYLTFNSDIKPWPMSEWKGK